MAAQHAQREILHHNQAKKVIEHAFSEFNSGLIISNLTAAKEFGDMLAGINHINKEKWTEKKKELHDKSEAFKWIKAHLKMWDFHVLESIYDWMDKTHKTKEKDHIYKFETEVCLSMLFHLEKVASHTPPAARLDEFERLGYRCLQDGDHTGNVFDALHYYFRKKDLQVNLLHFIHDHKPPCNLRDIAPESSDWRGYVMSTHFGNPFILYGAALKFHSIIHVISLADQHIEEVRFHAEDRKHVNSHVFIGHVSKQFYVALVPLDHIDSSSLPKEKAVEKKEEINFTQKIEKLERENSDLHATVKKLQEKIVLQHEQHSALHQEKSQISRELMESVAQIQALKDHVHLEKMKVEKMKVELEEKDLHHKKELEDERQRHKMALMRLEGSHTPGAHSPR